MTLLGIQVEDTCVLWEHCKGQLAHCIGKHAEQSGNTIRNTFGNIQGTILPNPKTIQILHPIKGKRLGPFIGGIISYVLQVSMEVD